MDACVRKYIAELFGTMVLVLFGCGVAIFSGGNLIATALAFGLAIVAMAYAIGSISGCHVNPAVSLAMLMNKKMDTKDFAGYVIAQVVGAIIGALILWAILVAVDVDVAIAGLGCNAFGDEAASGITLWGAILVEVILTMVFVLVIQGALDDRRLTGQEGIIIGLTLSFVHLLGIGLTGTSVNPARSLGPALVLAIAGQSAALGQVWVFILAPLIGGALAALLWKYVFGSEAQASE